MPAEEQQAQSPAATDELKKAPNDTVSLPGGALLESNDTDRPEGSSSTGDMALSAHADAGAEPSGGELVAAAKVAAPADVDVPVQADSEEPTGDTESHQAATTGGNEDSAVGDKKRRKRRRRKKAKTSASGHASGEGTPDAGGEGSGSEQGPPLAKFLEGLSGQSRHNFSPGEFVAGRVVRVLEGSCVVDLFGKALAVVDRRDAPLPTPRPANPHPASTGASPHAHHAVAVRTVRSTPQAEGAPEEAEQSEALADKEARLQDLGVDAEPGTDESHRAAGSERKDLPADDAQPGSAQAPEADQTGDPQAATQAGSAQVEDPRADQVQATRDAQGDASEAAADAAEAGVGTEQTTRAEREAKELAAALAAEPVAEIEARLDASGAVFDFAEGSVFRGCVGAVSESGHVGIVNAPMDREALRASLLRRRHRGAHVHGVVFGYNRGGFDVLVAGSRAFCSAGHMDLRPIDNPVEFLGQCLEFTLPQPRRSGGHVVLSRRSILEKAQRRAIKERLATLVEGSRVQGTVRELRDYGLLVDLGGVEGLVHLSELSWNRGLRPQDVATVGQQLEVQILKVHPFGRKDRSARVSLSVKATQPDPWTQYQDQLRPGEAIKGRVASLTEFGAFVELMPGVEGLLHINELGKNLQNADQVLDKGQELMVVVDRIDKQKRRLSLSRPSDREIAWLEDQSFVSRKPKSLKVGSHVLVRVQKTEHQGMHVQVVGVFGRKGRGYIANRDLGSLAKPERRRELVVGHEFEVRIAGVERDGALKLSVRGRELDEERLAVKQYRKEAASKRFGTFGDLLRARLGELPSVQAGAATAEAVGDADVELGTPTETPAEANGADATSPEANGPTAKATEEPTAETAQGGTSEPKQAS